MSKADTYGEKKRGSGALLALAVGLLWGAAIGVTWYFYRENDSEGGLAAFFGRFHILLVHLPIGLLFVVPLMEVVGWTRWGKKVREGVPFVLWIAVLTAAAASFLGYLMMHAEDIEGRWMTLHMWTGLAVGVFAVLALIFKLTKIVPLYALTLLGAVGSTMAAGHFGGAMIHSPEYLSEHAPDQVKPLLELGLKTGDAERGALDSLVDALVAAAGREAGGNVADGVDGEDISIDDGAADAAAADRVATMAGGGDAEVVIPISEQQVFADFVLPILTGKCTECHSEEKIKGKLRLDTHEMIMAGADGSDYATVIPKDAEGSELIARVLMPEDDDLFMPPDGKDKLTEAEIEVLKWWIAGGAVAEGTVADLQADEKMLTTLAAVSTSLASGEDFEVIVDTGAASEGIWPTLSPEQQQERVDAALAAADEGGFSVLPISAEDNRLRVSAVNASASFGDGQLASLQPVAERVVWLDIGRTQVTDAGMASIGGMRNLERLHLEQTAITDSGVKQLAGLGKLEYLNLYGTEVTAAIFEPLANLRNLRKLFLWETKVDNTAAQQFQRQMSLEVNTGWEVAKENEDEDVPEPAKPAPDPATDAKPAEKKPAEKKPEGKAAPKPAPTTAPAEKVKPAEKTKPAATPAAKPSPTPPSAPANKPEPKPEPAKPKPAAPAPKPQPAPTPPLKPEAS
jgi:hypothetical protein